MVHLYKQSDMLRNYGCIDSTVLRSYNTAGILASFYYLFVSHMMYCIKFEQTLHSKNKNLYWDFSLEWFFLSLYSTYDVLYQIWANAAF